MISPPHAARRTVPAVIVDLARPMAKKAAADARRAEKIKWPDKPGDVQDELGRAISAAHKTARAATDLRALLSAYAHRFHNPRPVISDLARARDTSCQGFIRRYSAGTVEAVASLLSSHPDAETILLAFPSVSLMDLVDLGGTVGAVAREMRDSDTNDINALNSLRQKRAGSADEDQARRTRDAQARLKGSHTKDDV
jgi:hypothetical protein